MICYVHLPCSDIYDSQCSINFHPHSNSITSSGIHTKCDYQRYLRSDQSSYKQKGWKKIIWPSCVSDLFWDKKGHRVPETKAGKDVNGMTSLSRWYNTPCFREVPNRAGCLPRFRSIPNLLLLIQNGTWLSPYQSSVGQQILCARNS